jgi:hypothetical protein
MQYYSYFEYGLSAAPYNSSSTAIQSPLSGTGISNISVNVTGLTTNKIYHYRVKAVTGEMIAYGEDKTFMTQVTDKDGNAYNTYHLLPL